jgi:hypothetical protein
MRVVDLIYRGQTIKIKPGLGKEAENAKVAMP